MGFIPLYAKRPFAGPDPIVEYLGRYTHKIAISNHRITSLGDNQVSFTAKDYRKDGARHTLSLTDAEFIRRFGMHVLPKGFVRIRHYGILSSSKKKIVLPLLMAEIGQGTPKEEPPAIPHRRCPGCKEGTLVTVFVFDSRGPPEHWLNKVAQQHKTPQIKTA